ncbi:MAG: AbrB/MazE/SpoVT family DNA-binding domain-containing protein [Thermomicrobiales bacterium]
MSQIITVTNKGRLTLPVAVRKALHIEEEAQLQVDVEGDTVILRPVVMIPREDAWAYTPEYRARAERAIKEPGFTLTHEELESLIDADDPQEAAAALIAKKLRSA